MEQKEIEINCDLLTWIKDMAEKSKNSQIFLYIKDGKIVRASCCATDVFGEEKK